MPSACAVCRVARKKRKFVVCNGFIEDGLFLHECADAADEAIVAVTYLLHSDSLSGHCDAHVYFVERVRC